MNGKVTLVRYTNRRGTSGVVAYGLADDAIVVEFESGHRYVYTSELAGTASVMEMQRLAEAGSGLAAYIAEKQPGFVRIR